MMAWRTAMIFPFDVAAGRAVFTWAWADVNGVPPSAVMLRRADDSGKPKILRTALRQDKDMDIAVSDDLFEDIARPNEQLGVPVRFRTAGFWLRVWYRPTIRLDLIVAVLALLAGIASATATLVTGLGRGSAPAWLLIAVFGLVCVAALVKLVQDVRKADM